LTLLGK